MSAIFFFFYICGICAGCVCGCVWHQHPEEVKVGRSVINRNVPTGEKRRSNQAAGETVQNTISDICHDADDSWILSQKQTQNRAGVFKQRKDDSKSALSVMITNQDRQPDRETCDNQSTNQSIINGKEDLRILI